MLVASPAQAYDFWGGPGSTTATSNYNLDSNWQFPPAPVSPGRSAEFAATGSATVVVTSPINPDFWVFDPTARSFSISGSDVSLLQLVNTGNSGQTIKISNNLSIVTGGSAVLGQSGASTLILSAKNTYSGGTAISAGTLVASHAAAGTIDALGTGPVTMTGGTLQFGANGTLNNSVTVSSGTGIISASTHNVDLASTVTVNPASTIQFGKAGDTGTILLSGSSSADATSSVIVGGGTLKDGGGGVLTGLTFFAASTTVNSGATLDFNNSFNQAIRNLNGGGNVKMGNAAGNNLTLFVDSTTTQTFSGTISGNHGSVLIEITGGPPGPVGTMIFTGANTYRGGTTICSCAALQLGDISNTGSIVGDVTVYGKFNVVNADTSGITTITNDREFPGATPGKTTFSNATSAGTIAITNLHAGKTVFNDTSTAANATIVNRLNGTTVFNNSATAGSAGITNRTNGETDFNNNSTAGTANIVNMSTGLTTFNNMASAGSANINNNGGETDFNNKSSAGAADIVNRTGGLTSFTNNSTAGSANITNRFGGETAFSNNSTAGGATIVNRFGGLTLFSNNSDAGNAGITNQFGGALVFSNKSSAASATIVNNSFGGPAVPFAGVLFTNQSSAGNAIIVNNNNGLVAFGVPFSNDKATAANANITNNAGSELQFNGLTTAGSATITTNSGAQVIFFDASTGGNARFITNGTGLVDFGQSIGPNFDGRITAGSIEGSGFYYIGGFNTLVVGGNNLSTEVSGVIADNNPCGCTSGSGSLEKVGSGQLTLSGINTYTGTTVVNGGFLNVMGSIASSSGTTVNNGGALTGSGIVSDTTIASGGIFLPGSGVGTFMSVQGNLAFQSGALYLVQLNSTNSTFADVTGTAQLHGDVGATFAPGSTVMKQYMILHAASGVSGTFDGLSVTVPNNLVASLAYDPTHAYINFNLNFGAANNLNVNQTNVANALSNFFNSNGGIPTVFATLSPAGLTQASGELATGTQQATFNAMNLFLSLLTDPFVAGRGGNVTAGGGAQPYAEEDGSLAYAAKKSGGARDALAKMPTKAEAARNDLLDSRWSVWGSAFGGGADIRGNAALGSNDANVRAFGFAAGADYRISSATVAGFALAGGGTNFSVTGSGYGRSDMFQAGAFVRHTIGAAYVTGALAYGGQEVTTDRFVTTAGLDHLRAQFNSNTWSGRLEGGYRYATPWMGITPYAAAQFTTIDLPAYAEQVVAGSGMFALNYNAKNVTDPRTELGVRTDRSFAMSNGILTLRGRLAWAHDYDTDRNITPVFQSLPGAFFVVNGAAQAHDSALTTASAEMRWLNGWSAAATFEGEFSNVMNSYAGKAVLRYAW